MPTPTMHLVTQRDQPYNSQRKCCEKCGLAIFAMKDHEFYIDDPTKFTKEVATDNQLSLCREW